MQNYFYVELVEVLFLESVLVVRIPIFPSEY